MGDGQELIESDVDDAPLRGKQARLQEILLDLGRVAVAFSGGVDSTFLLAVALDVLGAEDVLALTADSPLMTREELARAQGLAAALGAPHRVIPTDDLAVTEIAANPPRRCYYCKRSRFAALQVLLEGSEGMQLVHGENADDRDDYRPGSQAAEELHVRAPLAEAGLTKGEIRILSQRRGLPTWDLPAEACLATRFPYGTTLTAEALARVEAAESVLRQLLDVRQLRVRDHLPVARIELPAEAIPRAVEEDVRREVAGRLHELGYRYVTLDLDGYRMGAMNEGISTESG